MARSKMTPNPGSSTSQPMMPSVSGHRISPPPSMVANPPPPERSTAAAAPSPKRAVATILALLSLSSRMEVEQSSRATNRTIRRSEEHTSELQSLMRISYAVFFLKKKRRQMTREHQVH